MNARHGASQVVETDDGGALHVEQYGAGRPVVLIHGVLMSSRFFTAQVDRLAPFCRLVLFDLPGHGQSEAKAQGHTVAAYGQALHRLMETLDLRDAVLVGWSMGAFVMWDYLHTHGSDRTAHCVVVDELASDFKWPGHTHGALDLQQMCGLMSQIQSNYAGLAEHLLDAMFVTPPHGTERTRLLQEMLRVSPTTASAIFFDQTMRDFRDDLPKLATPTLVIAGADEKLVTVAGVENVAARLPNAEFRVFANSSHCPFMEEPDAFADAVRGFAGL